MLAAAPPALCRAVKDPFYLQLLGAPRESTKALKPRVAFSVGCLWDSATRITLGDVLDAAWMGNVAKKYLEEIPSHSAYLFLLFTAPHLSVFSTFCLQCRFTQKTRQHS